MQIAGITNINGNNLIGVSVSGLVGITGNHAQGVIISGLANISGDYNRGASIGGLLNISGEGRFRHYTLPDSPIFPVEISKDFQGPAC